MTSKPILLEPTYRSKLEERIAKQLDQAGVEYEYEGGWVRYVVPARDAKYLPDFRFKKGILIEAKGRFGHDKGDASGAKERQKLILLKQQHPELDIRIVFQNAKKPIYRGSKTSYARWAQDNGFLYADKGEVPAEWIKEIKKP